MCFDRESLALIKAARAKLSVILGRDIAYTGPFRIRIETRKGRRICLIENFPGQKEYAEPAALDHSRIDTKACAEIEEGAKIKNVRAFSPDEESILSWIEDYGTISGKVLENRTGIKHTRCAILVGNLRDRGIVVSGPEGYSLNPEILAETPEEP